MNMFYVHNQQTYLAFLVPATNGVVCEQPPHSKTYLFSYDMPRIVGGAGVELTKQNARVQTELNNQESGNCTR